MRIIVSKFVVRAFSFLVFRGDLGSHAAGVRGWGSSLAFVLTGIELHRVASLLPSGSRL